MIWNVNPEHTLYAVFLTLPEDTTIQIGALGTFNFPQGNYVYIGSAKKNIVKRTGRHYEKNKKKRWHLDYFRPFCDITEIQSFKEEAGECALAARFSKQGAIVVNRFGASDCRCPGHLILLRKD